MFKAWFKPSAAWRSYSTYRSFKSTYVPPKFSQRPVLFPLTVLSTGGFAIFIVSHIEKVPGSNRTRLNWMPEWAVKWQSNSTYNEMMRRYSHEFLPSYHPLQKKVETIADRLLAASEKIIKSPDNDYDDGTLIRNSSTKKFKREIHIINNNKYPPNAFVLPGGQIFVFSSILPLAKDDDGLAAVLSHEISHQLAQHISERLSFTTLLAIPSMLIMAATGIDLVGSINTLISYKHSRTQELEADYLGMRIMSAACFHPENGAKIWERFSEYNRYSPNEFLSTHPSDSTRVKKMQSWMPEFLAERGHAGCDDVTAFFSRDW